MAESDKHYMVDEALLEAIVDYAGLEAEDAVLEVGGGTGNLTEKIAKKGKVTVFEKDRSLAAGLRKRFKDESNVAVLGADALKAPYPSYNKIVSNIPYSISRDLLERFVVEGFEVAVLVVQREFARKLMAKPGQDSYRMVSVLAQTSCEIEYMKDVPPDAFEPVPKVRSAAIRMRQTWKPGKDYIAFLNRLFSQQNKKVRNIMDAPPEYAQMKPAEMEPAKMRDLYLTISASPKVP
ncbi:MAG: 16S rRNA (adenine(1518)-N(6)/adenine(1519)-N(6))-dimethyltransferase RsmA [Candidatus Altiarchaeota archaeon]